MSLLFFLILFPLVTAIAMLLFSNDTVRGWIVRLSALIICAASVYLLYQYIGKDTVLFPFENEWVEKGMLTIEILLAGFIFYMGLKYNKYLASVLVLIQAVPLVWFEIKEMRSVEKIVVENNLFIDKFSVIMALIIGIIGSLICVYALGYMKDFHHHHKEMKDNRSLFFFIVFLFLSAMFGIVFSNNIIWIYFFWEITTLCSFLLIGYTKTPEATNNAFRAIIMNLTGGVAFAAAIIFSGSVLGVLELDKMLSYGNGIVLIPALLICFAGITKSAQMPFSSWLLGAMVAPTPVSALLHSSTMVKAGVYIILRYAPVLQGNFGGVAVAMVGGVTFLVASLIAISQSNAKRVLAYSTVANLGLIVACAGIGTYEAVWAGILLVVFHAIAKSLLFLSVGTVEHNIGSRDIEDMDGLIMRMPKVAIMMVIGIAGMFLAPFGMLISKWAALKAFIDANPLLVGMLAFGSAATLFFWTKWMGKLIAVVNKQETLEGHISKDEKYVLMFLAAATVAVCGFFPVVSKTLIEPFIISIYGEFQGLSQGNITIMSIMLGLVLLLPLTLLFYTSKTKIVPAYLAGANVGDNQKFRDSLGQVKDLSMRNYYMEKYFGEKRMSAIGNFSTNLIFLLTVILIIMNLGVNII